MDYTTLGKTGLRVSVVGLGCGGDSRLGRTAGKTEGESVALVRHALDLGINLIDTAEAYKTESLVGKAIAGYPRDRVVVSTKKTLPPADHPDPESDIRKSLEQSLQRLGTDAVDIYHLHGVRPHEYRFARDIAVPVLCKLRDEGKIRFVGVTEYFVPDPDHRMLQEALEDNCWQVVMAGFNLLNPSARRTVFPTTTKKGVGVLVMFAVRRGLSRPERLAEIVAGLKSKGILSPDCCDTRDALAFLTERGKASTIPEAAYRFCRHERGVQVVLTGTGNPEHLKANVEAMLKPPLPAEDLQRLREIFGGVDSVTGA